MTSMRNEKIVDWWVGWLVRFVVMINWEWCFRHEYCDKELLETKDVGGYILKVSKAFE